MHFLLPPEQPHASGMCERETQPHWSLLSWKLGFQSPAMGFASFNPHPGRADNSPFSSSSSCSLSICTKGLLHIFVSVYNLTFAFEDLFHFTKWWKVKPRRPTGTSASPQWLQMWKMWKYKCLEMQNEKSSFRLEQPHSTDSFFTMGPNINPFSSHKNIPDQLYPTAGWKTFPKSFTRMLWWTKRILRTQLLVL